MKFIDCTENQLTSLDFSKNLSLTNVNCTKNQLTSIDLTKNSALSSLVCSDNLLGSLDLSMNTKLTAIYCNQNQITDLDLSKNILLKTLNCSSNQLTSLDISKNPSIQFFYGQNNQLTALNLKNGNNSYLALMNAYGNPNLTCIQVDNVANAASYSGWIKDEAASYNLDCNLSVNNTEKSSVNLYPNPVKDILHFSEEVSNVKITDLSGKTVKQISASGKSVNVSTLAKGVYIITATAKSGKTIIKKIIKE